MSAAEQLLPIFVDALQRQDAPARDNIDFLCSEFIRTERDAAEAYRVALLCDQRHEEIKKQLLDAVAEHGDQSGNRIVLQGCQHQAAILECSSSVIDPIAVHHFAHRVRVSRTCASITPTIFSCEVRWILRPEAQEFLKS